MARKARFTVSLNKARAEAAQVSWATVAGTATPPDDYTVGSGALIFAPGVTTMTVDVDVRATDQEIEERFTAVLAPATGISLARATGVCVLPGVAVEDDSTYKGLFNIVYTALHNPDNKYFGPFTGDKARSVPLHISGLDSLIINEAPDTGAMSVSETASFLIGMRVMYGLLNGDWTPFNDAWTMIDTYYVPSGVNQPDGTYDPASPASYIGEQISPDLYPPPTEISTAVGVDPIASELSATYGSTRIYLKQWLIDVLGIYGFKNGDGSTVIVMMSSYERGLQESSFETVGHPCWNDWNNGGGPFGYEPLYTQGTQVYPAAPFAYGKKGSYTSAPDAEARTIAWSSRAKKWAAAQGKGAQISASLALASKMGDYLRYALRDKFGRKIGDNLVPGGFSDPDAQFHDLIGWYAAFGFGIPETGSNLAPWKYIVSCGESSQGYQAVNCAYALARGVGNLVPLSPSAGDRWLKSVYKITEMHRWLQSPEGPIAGGVTNSIDASYQPATGGRERATFYGMHYVYSPVWHDPQSNNWVGFQAWGSGHTADLLLIISEIPIGDRTQLDNELLVNIQVILDRLVHWFIQNSFYLAEAAESGAAGWNIPSSLVWAETAPIAGETLTAPNHEGLYEYIPDMTWPDNAESPDYASFWDASTVPNTTLHCRIADWGQDLGVMASLAFLLIAYAKAKENLSLFETPIMPGSTLTPKDALDLAQNLLDWMYRNFWDGVGICIDEVRGDYNRLADEVYVPEVFTGTMPNGDVIQHGGKFIDTRSFLRDDPKWPEVEAYIAGTGPAPVFRYHRVWAQCAFGTACGLMHAEFPDRVPGSGVPVAEAA